MDAQFVVAGQELSYQLVKEDVPEEETVVPDAHLIHLIAAMSVVTEVILQEIVEEEDLAVKGRVTQDLVPEVDQGPGNTVPEVEAIQVARIMEATVREVDHDLQILQVQPKQAVKIKLIAEENRHIVNLKSVQLQLLNKMEKSKFVLKISKVPVNTIN